MSPGAANGSRFKRTRDHSLGPRIGARQDTQAADGQAARKLSASCWLEVTSEAPATYLTLIGELDMSCKERFMDVLKEQVAARPKHFVIDLRSLTFIDSTGIALLLTARAAAREDGFELDVVRSSTAIVQAVFDAAGVGKVLPLCDAPPQLRT